jgi:hypothetical protein
VGRGQGDDDGGGRAAGRVGAAARVGNGALGGGGDCARATGGWVVAFSAGRTAGNQPTEQMIASSWSSPVGSSPFEQAGGFLMKVSKRWKGINKILFFQDSLCKLHLGLASELYQIIGDEFFLYLAYIFRC